ncbi:AbrB/MazE/SpoVT family DNA-binding domain-containing protein [Helicobacter sp. 13S00477-4]|uniref:AbrB/MazE/SpoVT family DNA-binding domain-containing protein n=1 Tax=Helicobacter sp. 13S00477-4 TaxID=1905759 RepID=UPI000BA7DC04|nr:AbrB/MazE/SpoVT family DNA-binding domain-containing protein [Helicobacter sp. 13S00477-4]PAF50320.1 hypothetical protein BKH44_08480 [Helicobacter sp. 13S00477-4]
MTNLIKIGNSMGIRIPKAYIEKMKLQDSKISFEIVQDGLLLKPIPINKRENWEEKIKLALKINQKDNDEFLNLDLDFEGWE